MIFVAFVGSGGGVVFELFHFVLLYDLARDRLAEELEEVLAPARPELHQFGVV